MVIVVIVFAMFIYFCPIGESDRVNGGHKVDVGDKTLHIKNYKLLKEVLSEKYPEWDKEAISTKAKRIVDDIIAEMCKKQEDQPDEESIDEESIDKEIMKWIESNRNGNPR